MESYMWFKHFGYWLKAKTGRNRSVPMPSIESIVTRFFKLRSGHVPIGTYLWQFWLREQ
jgi:hypothetical protein